MHPLVVIGRVGLRQTIRVVHISLILFVMFAWLIESVTIWRIHLLFIPLMVFHWKTNDDQCWLTEWEQKLDSNPRERQALQGFFIRRLFKVITCGRSLSEQNMDRLIYGVLAISWLLSLARLQLEIFR